MASEFKTVSGGASSARATPLLEATDRRRWVQLVLDDSNWCIEVTSARSPEGGERAKVPYSGPIAFWLEAGQELNAWAALATGGAGTVWSLAVYTCAERA